LRVAANYLRAEAKVRSALDDVHARQKIGNAATVPAQGCYLIKAPNTPEA